MHEWQRETGRDATFQEDSFRLAVTKGEIKSCCQATFRVARYRRQVERPRRRPSAV